MILTIRPATLTDARWLGENLREEDRQEVETSTGTAASAVVSAAFSMSRECYTVRRSDGMRIEQDPCLIFGVVDDPHNINVGVVWLLATDSIRGANFAVIREARHWLASWLMRYPSGLHNTVDKRNQLHIRWLSALGFTLEGEVLRNGQPFVHATLRSST